MWQFRVALEVSNMADGNGVVRGRLSRGWQTQTRMVRPNRIREQAVNVSRGLTNESVFGCVEQVAAYLFSSSATLLRHV